MLETNLETPVFERRGRSIALTDAGRALLPHAEAALAAVEDGFRAVQQTIAETDGALTLAVVGTIADSYLVEALRAFQSEFADIQIDLQTANSLGVSDLVRQGDADIGLRYYHDPDPRLEVRSLGAERLYVVVPANHPITAGRRRTLKAFAGDRWLGFPSVGNQSRSLNQALIDQFTADGAAAPQITTVDSLTAQKRLVEAGFGVAMMPKRNVQDELAAGSLRLVEVTSFKTQMPVVMVRRRGRIKRKPESALANHLGAHIPELLDS